MTRAYRHLDPLRYSRAHAASCGVLPPAVFKLLSKIDVQGPTDCWPWIGHHPRAQFTFSHEKKRFRMDAPRCIAVLHLGLDAVKGRQVRHDCGDNICCNPAHMSVDGVPLLLPHSAPEDCDAAAATGFRDLWRAPAFAAVRSGHAPTGDDWYGVLVRVAMRMRDPDAPLPDIERFAALLDGMVEPRQSDVPEYMQ